jgi:protein-S-isoprenylcysteine O-methyltransferase Ste14
MGLTLPDAVAFAVLVLWPAIPLFWIPVHSLPSFFRRLGFTTYILPLITWLPVAVFMFKSREFMLSFRFLLPEVLQVTGIFLFIVGACLQIWTIALLTLPGIIGMPEVTRTVPGSLVATGPFSVMRHPTYLSHTLMFLGLFLWTGLTALAVVTIVDALVVSYLIIPLEERELLARFGKEYEVYCQKVTARFVPILRSRCGTL